MLSAQQEETFFKTGILYLRQIVGPQAAGFEDFVWDCLEKTHGILRHDRSTWDMPAPWVGLKEFKDADVLATIGTDDLHSAIDDLLGPDNWNRPRQWGGFLVNLPNTEPADWYIPKDGWHVDYHYTYDSGALFGLRVLTFLNEVKPRSGGTLVVPGSHKLVARFVDGLSEEERSQKYAVLRKQFDVSNPWMRKLTQSDERDPNRVSYFMEDTTVVDGIPLRIEQLCGSAGDVVLMHPWLLHAASPNAGDAPRFMLSKSLYARTSAVVGNS